MSCHQSCPNRQVRLSPQVLDSPENSVAIPKERYRSAKLRVRYFLFARFRPKMANSILRSEEHTSELQSLMRISYAVFCLKKKNTKQIIRHIPESPRKKTIYE